MQGRARGTITGLGASRKGCLSKVHSWAVEADRSPPGETDDSVPHDERKATFLALDHAHIGNGAHSANTWAGIGTWVQTAGR